EAPLRGFLIPHSAAQQSRWLKTKTCVRPVGVAVQLLNGVGVPLMCPERTRDVVLNGRSASSSGSSVVNPATWHCRDCYRVGNLPHRDCRCIAHCIREKILGHPGQRRQEGISRLVDRKKPLFKNLARV